MATSSDDAFADEIVEIFVEEVSDVLNQIDSNLPEWERNVSNTAALKEVRRAFHTLKGSGRMVQAMEIGELAWAVESMLNRVIDGTIKTVPVMFDLVKEVRHTVPAMLEAFRNKQALALSGVNFNQYIQNAQDIIAGKSVSLSKASPAKPAAKAPEMNFSPEFIKEEEAMQAAHLASNMAPSVDMVEFALLKERLSELGVAINEMKRNYVTMSTQLDSLSTQVKMMPKSIDPVAINKQLKQADQEIQELKYFIKASSEKMMADINDSQRRLDVKVDKELRVVNGLGAQLESEMQFMGKQLRTETANLIKKWAIGSGLIAFVLSIIGFIILK